MARLYRTAGARLSSNESLSQVEAPTFPFVNSFKVEGGSTNLEFHLFWFSIQRH
jgi:hypothetical protein